MLQLRNITDAVEIVPWHVRIPQVSRYVKDKSTAAMPGACSMLANLCNTYQHTHTDTGEQAVQATLQCLGIHFKQ